MHQIHLVSSKFQFGHFLFFINYENVCNFENIFQTFKEMLFGNCNPVEL